MQLDKPNFKLPLASSYNERNLAGFTATVTNGLDQRKINTIYEPVQNSATGKNTLYLARRPGVTIDPNTYGSADQVAFLISLPPSPTNLLTTPWVFSTSGNDVRASDSAQTSVLMSSGAGYKPLYVDKTAISGQDTIVVQAGTAAGLQRTFYLANSLGAGFNEITISAFANLVKRGKMEFVDGYALQLDSSNRIYNSDLNTLATWSAANFITKSIRQDIANGLARFNNQILAFGDETVEVFTNAGNPTGSPLGRVQSLANRIGLASPLTLVSQNVYYAIAGQHLYFVGRRAGGDASVCVFAYNGQTYEKVSTPFIDKILEQRGTFNIYKVGFGGKEAIALNLTNNTTNTQQWLMFFPDWKEWFEWTSTVFTPINCGQWFLGAPGVPNKAYTVSYTDNWLDDTTAVTATHQFKIPSSSNDRKRMPWAGVVCDKLSAGSSTSAGSVVSIAFSDNDYQSFGSARNIDMRVSKTQIYRCGSYFDRAVRITHTGNAPFRAEQFIARIE